jgi:hypothetical protein
MTTDRIPERRRRKTTSLSDRRASSQKPRIVYLATPASDMEPAYVRLATEFSGRGYGIVPDVQAVASAGWIPPLSIGEALGIAETSVHLIGEAEAPGSAVALQLAQARSRTAASNEANGTIGFRRYIWVPRIFRSASSGGDVAIERDPIAALIRFDVQIATDKIIGDVLGKFIEYLFQELDKTGPRPAPSETRLRDKRPRSLDDVAPTGERSAPTPRPNRVGTVLSGGEHEAKRYYVSYAWADPTDPDRKRRLTHFAPRLAGAVSRFFVTRKSCGRESKYRALCRNLAQAISCLFF